MKKSIKTVIFPMRIENKGNNKSNKLKLRQKSPSNEVKILSNSHLDYVLHVLQLEICQLCCPLKILLRKLFLTMKHIIMRNQKIRRKSQNKIR